MEAGDSVILTMPGQVHPIWEHIPMAACTAGVMHNPMGAMVIAPMQPLLNTEPILMVHMVLAEDLGEALAEALAGAEALAEEDGGKFSN